MSSSVEQRVKELAADDEPTTGDTVFKIIKRFCLKCVAWYGIYALGYYGFSIAWLLTPLLLTVFRQQWKKEIGRMFMDAHTKVFTLFLDTLIELVVAHKADLGDWLHVLLTR